MAVKQIITGLMSYGMSGRVFHAPFIVGNEGFQLKAVVERTSKQIHLQYPEVVSYSSIQELLDDDEIELVIVNTPNDTHVEFATMALQAGKHVLIEKPFAPTAEQAKGLFDLGRKMNRLVLPYHNRRFDSDFQSLVEILQTGRVGKPVELHLRFDRFKPEIGVKIFKETKRPASGILYDLGSHLLDQTISIFGRPKSVTKILTKNRTHTQVDDYASIVLSYPRGLSVFITVSLLAANPQKSFVLHGTKGSFVKNRTDIQEQQLLNGMTPLTDDYGREAEGQEGILTEVQEDGLLVSEAIAASKGDYMHLFDAVFAAIRHNQPYFVSEDQILWQLEILEPSR
ncbi:Gfo/Idh/MocA family protein [Sphingobacterium sp. SYP-B4668]|uniref:Gfo/Idh/MocA family protein n=1 Tax=Sphingobacterium sp. SYP-B4668 TaxID=2996035 RepID=UPI0022DE393E|nr:Gfo/Idh/MocA family oxidoreductase [Sphingobacterium sp. SYP-B4668]